MKHPIFRTIIAVLPALFMAGGCNLFTPSDSTIRGQATNFHSSLEPAVMEDKASDPVLERYMQAIGSRIIEAARAMDVAGEGPKAHTRGKDNSWMFNVQFHLVNSKTLNAFTTGGDHIYIYNELLQDCKNENELAAVMSHEYAHIYCRHVQSGTDRQYKVLAGALALGGAGYLVGGKEKGAEYAQLASQGATVAGSLINMGFTRDDEAQADEWGWYFYTRAGWDPAQFGGFFQTMIDKGLDTAPEMLSDHPSLKNRVAWAKKMYDQGKYDASWRKPPVASPAEFEAIKKKAAALGQRMPDDKSLANSQQLLQALPRSCIAPVDPADRKSAADRLAASLRAQAAKPRDARRL